VRLLKEMQNYKIFDGNHENGGKTNQTLFFGVAVSD